MDGIAFGTDGWRAPLESFTSERVRAVGQAVATTLADADLDRPVAVGYDAREHSPGFAAELTAVLRTNGFDVVTTERDRPTPLYAHAVLERDLAGALVVTASHNPPSYNGVKFVPETGAPALPAVMDAIADNLEPARSGEPTGSRSVVDVVGPHARDALALVDGDCSGLSVAYDAMHGSGRGTTDALLERAGADVTCLRCSRDPTFGGTAPEPAADRLPTLINQVTTGQADLGIANDGDADRLAVVTPRRGHLDENLFFAALYDHLLQSASGPAVRTVSTSYLIDRVASAHGESVVEVPVGFKWVAEAMAEHDALVGGEESGGFSVRGHVREKDGVAMALLAAAMHAEEPLDDRVDRLLAEHGTVVQDKESVSCPDEEKATVMAALEDAIPESLAGVTVESVSTADGFKLQLADGSWVLVRPSGTEPALRVYAEADSEDRVATLLESGTNLLAAVR